MKVFAVLLALACVPAPAMPQSALPTADSLTRLLQPWLTTGTATGIVAGIVANGDRRIVAIGRVGAEGTGPATDSTTFEIGSISKVLTGTLLADMVLRGEVKLDDPVRLYLPASVRVPSRNGKEITLGHLATHYSGLPRDPGNLRPAASPGGDQFDGYAAADLYAFLSEHTLRRDPGETDEYSNLGVSLLGHILGLKAGKSYEALVTERILAPLGMRDTYITPGPAGTVLEAIGHSQDLEPVPASRRAGSVMQGSGGWRSSARDMLRFGQAAAEVADTPVGRALTLAMTAVSKGFGQDSAGLGWSLNDEGPRLAWHNGGTGGFSAMFIVEPSTRRAVVVMTNTYTSMDGLGFHLIDQKIRLTPPVVRPSIAMSIEAMDRLAAVYTMASGSQWKIYREEDRLYFEPGPIPRVRLYPESETRFFTKLGRTFEFVVDSTGAVTEVVMRDRTREWRAKRS